MAIKDEDIMKIISETFATTKKGAGKSVLNEVAYVLQPKSYSIDTDIISSKALSANIADFENTVKVANEISAKLDSADKAAANYKDSDFRELKCAEAQILTDAFLTSLHLDNMADPTSQVAMDSIAYMRLARDFGTFDDWQKDFIACAMSARNGYAVTVYNGFLNRYMNLMVDDSSLGLLYNCFPVICLSVKESFYFRDYLNDRRSYVFAMMKELKWSLIEKRIKKADKLAQILSQPLGV